MERNPNAPKGALAFDDLRPGMEVVVIRGGAYYHERVTIHSKPYTRRHPVADPQHIGKVTEIESWFVRASSGGAAASTEISRAGQGASNRVTERSLSDMGLCPSHVYNGWSPNYTVLAAGYRPDDHY
jgi:hypothetical protein